ncbi:5'-flap endonuclease [Didymella heteroderae]|uniref:Structure-specific endonuclease subunit SLX4 n=1 Tax=Didymella heteroderae TaxID=1769908 RepID=A0A9P5C0U0_9PLEO|nr:5'-flap endonuclease [Didymella heteroderae]
MPPSSPFALSPPTSPRKHTPGALNSGSRAAPITDKATRGFATVSSLVRSEHFAQQLHDDSAESRGAQSRRGSAESIEKVSAPTKKSRQRAAKDSTVADGEKPRPKPRGRKPKANKELESNSTNTLEPELRLPPTRKSPFLENGEAQTTVETPAEPTADAPKLTKLGKPRKPRAKKKVDDGVTESEPKSRKARVTKPKAAAKAGKASREDADVASTHFSVDKDQVNADSKTEGAANPKATSIWDMPQSPRAEQNVLKRKSPDPVLDELDLDEAVSRRRDWTPPRDTVAQSPSTGSIGKENRPMTREATTGAFTSLITNFTYESPTVKVASNTTMSKEAVLGMTKRRRAELVELPGVQTISRSSSPEKGKAPKKKPRTITDLVTGQYASRDTPVDVQAVTTDFFAPRTSTTKVPLDDIALDGELPQKKARRKYSKPCEGTEGVMTKAKSRARKAPSKLVAKPKPVAEKLLSPTSAVTRMNQQDVLFGTSSQLALEESPTTVRQIQRAIAESEMDLRDAPQNLLEISPRWPRLKRIEGKRSLWRESTRDGDGGLLENPENVYIPEPDRTQDLPLLMDDAQDGPSLSSAVVDIDDLGPAMESGVPIAVSSDLPTPPESQSQKLLTEPAPKRPAHDGIFEDIDDFEDGHPPPSNQNVESQTSFADIDDFQSAPPSIEHNPPPGTSTLSASASASAQAMTSGSPRKRRGRPPKAKSGICAVPESAPPTSRKLISPQQTPQRFPSTPPKESGRFIDIEEILDSEDEVLEAFSPTPPRVRKLQDSPPLPLAFDQEVSTPAKISPDERAPLPIFRILTSHLEWVNIKATICSAITAHVRSIPPTTNPKKPSWHEKILMYDPIILEDFTAYLNSHANLRTYRRATQKQIKAYNNELKIKGNAILGVEKDDQVLAIEKELEVYMVRDWCEAMSICCVHAKESRGRGSARKGFY